MKDIREIAKHRKKKKSNTSSANLKSNHKHDYKSCVLSYTMYVFGKHMTNYSKGTYCIKCGKIGEKTSFVRGLYHSHDENVRLAKQAIERGEPVFDIDFFKDKFVVTEE